MTGNTRRRLERLESGLKRDSEAIPPERYAEVARMVEEIRNDPEPMDPQEAERIMQEVIEGARRHGWRG